MGGTRTHHSTPATSQQNCASRRDSRIWAATLFLFVVQRVSVYSRIPSLGTSHTVSLFSFVVRRHRQLGVGVLIGTSLAVDQDQERRVVPIASVTPAYPPVLAGAGVPAPSHTREWLHQSCMPDGTSYPYHRRAEHLTLWRLLSVALHLSRRNQEHGLLPSILAGT